MRLSTLGLFTLVTLLAGCVGDAERGNPLDPNADGFRDTAPVSGSVTDASEPYEGIAGAEVRLRPLAGGSEQVVQTGPGGSFSLDAIPSGTYAATAQAPGYAGDTDTLTVMAGFPASVTLRLDGLPIVLSRAVRAEHIDRWWPGPIYRLAVDAEATDPDGAGDLATVRLTIPSLGFTDSLTLAEPGRYTRTFREDELPVTVQELLGRDLIIETLDRGGRTGSAQPVQIVRIIESVPTTIAPSGTEGTGATPLLTWNAASLPFAFTYTVSVIFVTPGLEVEVARFEGLPGSQTSVQVQTPLQTGDHYWTVAVVDAFGNLSRSKEAGFVVGAMP